MKNRSFLFVLALSAPVFQLQGCATSQESARNEGMSAFHSRNYDETVRILAPLKANRPDDGELDDVLARASSEAMREKLKAAQAHRVAFEPQESFSAYRDALRFLRPELTSDSELYDAFQTETRAQAQALREKSPWRGLEIKELLSADLSRMPGLERDQWNSAFADARLRGQSKCEGITARIEKPHLTLSELTDRICSRFGSTPLRVREASAQFKESQYRAVQLHLEVAGIPADSALLMGEQLNKRLANSPAFEYSGKKLLRVDVRGRFEDLTEKRVVPLTHPYTGRKGEKLEYSHTGTETNLRYSIHLKTEHRYDGLPIQVELKEKLERTEVEHFDDIPGISLTPKQVELPRPESWVSIHTTRFSDQILDAWIKSTRARHCEEPRSSLSWSAQGDRAAMCLRVVRDTPPAWVVKWWSQTFGEAQF